MVKIKKLSLNRRFLIIITRHEKWGQMYELLRDWLSSIISNWTLPHYILTDGVITQHTLRAERSWLLVVRLIDNEGCGLVNLVLIWDGPLTKWFAYIIYTVRCNVATQEQGQMQRIITTCTEGVRRSDHVQYVCCSGSVFKKKTVFSFLGLLHT